MIAKYGNNAVVSRPTSQKLINDWLRREATKEASRVAKPEPKAIEATKITVAEAAKLPADALEEFQVALLKAARASIELAETGDQGATHLLCKLAVAFSHLHSAKLKRAPGDDQSESKTQLTELIAASKARAKKKAASKVAK
jgi:hypothetical protein